MPHDELDSLAYGSHTAPLAQQPAHEPLPQLHVPSLVEQESPLPHAAHATPPVPHCESVCSAHATQVLPLQQPFGHELVLHWHWPGETHASPVGHPAQV